MYAPDAGSVTLDGRAVGGLTPGAITQAGIGRSFQITNLFPSLTVAENVRLAVQSRDRKRFGFWTAAKDLEQVNSEATEMIRTMGLAGIERAEAGSLSYGSQRLLDMALALATRPRILLLDEPFEGLAPAVVEELFEAFDKLRREISILIVDHHLDLALALSDRTVALERGQVAYMGPSKALSEDLDLRRKVLWL